MFLFRKNLKQFSLIVLSLVSTLGFAADNELPVAAFASLPAVDFPVVSPDGSKIAAIVNGPEGPEIAMSDFGGNALETVARFSFGHTQVDEVDRVSDLRWAGNNALLISVVDIVASTVTRGRRHFIYNLDTKILSPIWRQSDKGANAVLSPVQRAEIRTDEGTRNTVPPIPRDYGRIISYLPSNPSEIMVELYAPEDRAHAVFRVNLLENDWQKLESNRYPIDRWHADSAGRVLFAEQLGPETKAIWYSPDSETKFKPILELPIADNESFVPLTAADGTAIVISDHESGYRAIWTYDLASGEFGTKLFSVDGVDISSVALTNDASEVRSASYTQDYPTTTYFKEGDIQRANLVAKSFPGYHTSIVSESASGKQIMVATHRDDAPLKYFWIDLAKNAAGAWYSPYPDLAGKPLAKKQLISFEAQDGMQLNGYLTIPERADGKKPPLVIFPHDGPDSRDDQRFDPVVQFFANRGYAVLQPNYRGSSGFGTAYKTSGYREWGMAMQDDLVAAVNWLDEQDLIDSDRKCIVGYRYAGYTALVAAYRRQMSLRCAVAIAAPYSLYKFTFKEQEREFDSYDRRRYEFKPDHSSDEIGKSILKNFPTISSTIGNPLDGDDKDMLKANSPINNIRKFNTPVLVVHGAHDSFVSTVNAAQFVRKMESEKRSIEYLHLDFGGHFINGQGNRIETFSAIDDFLDKYLN